MGRTARMTLNVVLCHGISTNPCNGVAPRNVGVFVFSPRMFLTFAGEGLGVSCTHTHGSETNNLELLLG